MRIAAWNIRGFGAQNKKSMINCLIKENYLDLVGFVETKHAELSQWDMVRCWGHQSSQYIHNSAVEGSGGIIVSCRPVNSGGRVKYGSGVYGFG